MTLYASEVIRGFKKGRGEGDDGGGEGLQITFVIHNSL